MRLGFAREEPPTVLDTRYEARFLLRAELRDAPCPFRLLSHASSVSWRSTERGGRVSSCHARASSPEALACGTVIVKVASFNLFGIGGKDVSPAVAFAQGIVPATDPALEAIAFQEVWTEPQRDAVLDAYLGPGATATARTNVDIYRQGTRAFRALVPRVPGVISMPLSSGLVLCVAAPVRDCFFVEYRGGAIPDSLAHKGVLAALVEPSGRPRRAIVATHMHDYSNDRFGQNRWAWIDTIISCVQWINRNWNARCVVLGDFNIDSITAYSDDGSADYRLYTRLIRIGMGNNAVWYDINARVHAGRPIRTTANKAIDHHLVAGETPTGATFSAHSTPHSDHYLTVSTW